MMDKNYEIFLHILASVLILKLLKNVLTDASIQLIKLRFEENS